MPTTQNEINSIQARFYSFCDGVIRLVSLRFEENGSRTVELAITTRDSECMKNEGWVCVRFIVEDVSDFHMREGIKTPIQVLSQGIHLLLLGNQIGIDFGGSIECPMSLDSLLASDGFVIGRMFEIQVGEYS